MHTLLIVGVAAGLTMAAAGAAEGPAGVAGLIEREGWSHDRAQIEWYHPDKEEQERAAGRLHSLAGWAEYDFDVAESGWYELWESGNVWGWSRDVYLDGQILFHLTTSAEEDTDKGRKGGWFKEANLWLPAGRHTLRFRRLGFPGCLPSRWELRPAEGRPEASLRVAEISANVVRAGTPVTVKVLGGTPAAPLRYELVLRKTGTEELTPVGVLEFAAAAEPLTRELSVTFPAQGSYALLARSGETLLRPADLKAGLFVVVDTLNPPPPAPALETTPVVDIDCVAQTLNGRPVVPRETFFEKDGATRVVEAPFGSYRESSGAGTNDHWALDGFSYRFELPDADHGYRLRVDYPDDDRRSMGFWINDGSNARNGVTLTGGVETGDHYRLSRGLLAHEAFFYPLNATGLVVAVLNLNHGGKAAAARIRIDRVDSALPVGPSGPPGGRAMGFYFEESPRWVRFFGGRGGSLDQHLLTLDRWGQWNRYLGANLMFPTINVYQYNGYPSRLLDGYFSESYDMVRLVALMAEKYGSRFVPEFHLSGQRWFDKHVMGVWTEEVERDGKKVEAVRFRDALVEEYVIRNRDGGTAFGWKAAGYNALHPKVQETYISVFGELADRLADCESFSGISSRLMLGWQWQGWNALPGLYWGYDDWTVREFEKDTGLSVPGGDDPKRFRRRYDFLAGPAKPKWEAWRCRRLFAYHCRLRDRLRQAKPDAKLFFTYFGPSERETPGLTLLDQMREIGMDWNLYAGESGFVIISGGTYGRRFTTPVADAGKLEPLYDAEVKTVARLGDRGFSLYSDYYEVNRNLDWAALGGKPYGAFDACAPAGIHERELYAIGLADSDTSFFVNGGNGWIFGTPSVMQPFLREYRALPAVPFTPVPGARDPVAVWLAKVQGVPGQEAATWFYAVNRLPQPVQVSLKVTGAQRVFGAADAQPVELSGAGGDLVFTLDGYMLRSFRAEGEATGVSDCRVEMKADIRAELDPMLAFARSLREDLLARRAAVELSDPDARAAVATLDESLQALADGRWWQARTGLERVHMVRLYDMIGRYPPGLHDRQTPRGFPADAADAPSLVFGGESSILGDVRGRLSGITDLAYDRGGNLWAASEEQLMVFSPTGAYLRSYRLVMPHDHDTGDSRWSALRPPVYLGPDSLRVLGDGRIAAMRYDSSACLFEPRHGRVLRLETGYGLSLPGWRCRYLAVTAADQIFVGCAGDRPGDTPGVWKFNADGAPAFDFGAAVKTHGLTPAPARGLAVDAAGRLYFVEEGAIRVCAGDGTALRQSQDGPRELEGRLAVTPDGRQVFVLTARGEAVAAWQLAADETGLAFQWQTRLPARAAALAWSPDALLTVGFQGPADGGAVVRDYRVEAGGLVAARDRVPGLAGTETACLRGFTQLKVRDGCLHYLAHNRLMRLTPGEPDRVEAIYDPGPLQARMESFAFTPGGDLYLASNFGLLGHSRGMNVYLARRTDTGWDKPVMLNGGKPLVANSSFTPTDLECDGQGRLLLRLDDPEVKASGPTVSIFALDADGRRERLLHLGPTVGWGDYGLHRAGDGRLYIAGGGARAVACLDAGGALLWERRHTKAQGPGSIPLRDPLGIATDGRGRVWVTDPAGNRLLCFDGEGRFLRAFGHFGTLDDRDGEAFCRPVGIAAVKGPDGRERLYVADVNNQRLVRFGIEDARNGGKP